MKAKLPSSILNETDLSLKQCKTEFSDFISSHFANELQQSKEYESFATNDGAGHALWKVNRKGHSQKHRVVSLKETSGLLHRSCYTTSNTGAPCRTFCIHCILRKSRYTIHCTFIQDGKGWILYKKLTIG